ncbi:NCK-interacting protein with SH3 domain isoform X2 [Seriola lalandi dorsalis]|uniref:NCK-interacting protein with SH3 domain isoform X2 n=1 Tax=Seriola lalandi dorsalis TaxID=1841481 RepID=UPI000C6F8DC4|nr:NCK-interacting protein with SH3 domain isoform X2 [Seriola lalandi dorsalis]XP_056245803.1 NCK-interacting protein with SH3 domain-like isoform X2 [Seriola aureovittata]
MYRSLYAFRSAEPNSLHFAAGESFLILERSNKHWWLGSRCSSGETGYIPASYIEKIQAPEQDEVLQSIDRAIEGIHNVALKNGGKYNLEQRDVLQKLIHHRKETLARRSSSSSGHKQGLPSSSSEISLSQTPPPPNGLNRDYGRQGSMPLSGSMDNMQAEQGFYQVPPQPRRAAPITPPPPEKQRNSRRPEPEVPSRVSSLPPSPAPSLSISTTSLESGSSHSLVSSDVSFPSVSSTPPPPVPSRVKPSALPPDAQPSDSSPQPAPAKKSPAPQPPKPTPPLQPAEENQPESEWPVAPPSVAESPPGSPTTSEPVPMTIGAELIELVRKNTGLSYELSRVAVGVVVGHLQTALPQASSALEQVLVSLVESKDLSAALPQGQVCHDEQRLEVIFSDLARHRDDSQQRSWALHEDHALIACYLEELLKILTDADPEVCKRMCKANHYENVLSLVSYYQMEHRVSLRLLLLKVFGAMCSLDAALISTLLNAILPMELARDLQTDTQEHQKMCYTALVLTMIFSMGEQVPYHHYEHLNADFVQFLLGVVEDGLPSDPTEQLPDTFLNLLLAFNLHHTAPSNNVIMQELKKKNVKILSEKVLLLLNRGDDPVCMFKHTPPAPHSVLKFLQDVFASRETADIFYSTDMMVMIDIAVRQISDLSPGDKLRMEYLSLMHSIMRSTDYLEHQHRLRDLQGALQRILREEEDPGEDEGSATAKQMDKLIVQQIYKEFPKICENQD